MTTFVLIHGASSDGWYWHLVTPHLQAAGHDVVAPDLPVDDDTAGIEEYANTVVEAIGDRTRPGARRPVDGRFQRPAGGRSPALQGNHPRVRHDAGARGVGR